MCKLVAVILVLRELFFGSEGALMQQSPGMGQGLVWAVVSHGQGLRSSLREQPKKL